LYERIIATDEVGFNDSAYPGKFLDLKMLLLLYGYERTEKE